MNENNFEIKEEQRQSWLSIAAIWAGGMICVPCLIGPMSRFRSN